MKNPFSFLFAYRSTDRYPVKRNLLLTIMRAGLWILSCFFFFTSCETIDLYEKNVVIPRHRWASSFKPEFNFTIKDTAVPYQLYFTFRHTEKYNYNNIWINIYTQPPGDSVQILQKELILATADKGWLGAGMDDIYEHRIELMPSRENLYFRKTGDYKFIIEHIMREDPLNHVMNVGLRVEKKQ